MINSTQTDSSRTQISRVGPLLAIGLGVSVGPLDSSANIAFPAITAAFDMAVGDIQWVIICYVLTYACLLLAMGRLGDILGHRRLFLLGLIWSAVAFTLCALAESLVWLLPARALQGIGTALIFGSGPALATSSYPPEMRSKIVGYYLFAFGCAHASGPLIGGALVEPFGWQAIFWFRVPLSLIALVAVWYLIPVSRKDDDSAQVGTPDQRFDFPGALAIAIGIAALLMALNRGGATGWLNAETLTLAALAAIVSSYFIWHIRRSSSPLIDPLLFRSRTFCAINSAHILANLAHFSVFLLVPYFLVNELGAPLWLCGLMLAHQPIGMTLASPLTGHLLARMRATQLAAAGAVLSAAGLTSIWFWHADMAYLAVVVCLILQGFGHGVFQVASMDFVMARLPQAKHGVAGSLSMLTRTIGVATAAGLWALLFTVFSEGDSFIAGFSTTFLLAGLAAAGAALIVIWAARTSQES